MNNALVHFTILQFQMNNALVHFTILQFQMNNALVHFTILQFQMNNAPKKAAEFTLLSPLTKKSTQPLWLMQLWTFVKMVFSCWPAVAAAVAPQMGICAVAAGIAMASSAVTAARDEASCKPLDGRNEKTSMRLNPAASCAVCAAWFLKFSKSEYAFDKLPAPALAQFWMLVPVEMTANLYTVTDMKQDRQNSEVLNIISL